MRYRNSPFYELKTAHNPDSAEDTKIKGHAIYMAYKYNISVYSDVIIAYPRFDDAYFYYASHRRELQYA